MRNLSLSGRVIGGLLILIALGWILQLAGAFPFRRSNTLSQIEADRPPIPDPTIGRAGASIYSQPRQGTQSFNTNTNKANTPNTTNPPNPPSGSLFDLDPGRTTPGPTVDRSNTSNSGSTTSGSTANNGTSNSGTSSGYNASGSGTSSSATTVSGGSAVVPAGW